MTEIFFFLTPQDVFCWLNSYDFCSFFICSVVVKFSWQKRQLCFMDIAALKVRSSPICLTRIDIFRTPGPVVSDIELLQVTLSTRTRVLMSIELHQNGLNVVTKVNLPWDGFRIYSSFDATRSLLFSFLCGVNNFQSQGALANRQLIWTGEIHHRLSCQKKNRKVNTRV